MILLVACAVLGAGLGLYAKPRWLGVAVAVTLVTMVETGERLVAGMLADRPNHDPVILRLHAIFGDSPLDALGPIAAVLIGGALAALMGQAMDGDRTAAVVNTDGIRRRVGKGGRYARLDGMIHDRPIHAKAERRINKILDL